MKKYLLFNNAHNIPMIPIKKKQINLYNPVIEKVQVVLLNMTKTKKNNRYNTSVAGTYDFCNASATSGLVIMP